MFIWTAVTKTSGYWLFKTEADLDDLAKEDPGLAPMFARTLPQRIVTLAESLTTDPALAPASYNPKHLPDRLARWKLNPLTTRPLVRLSNGAVVAPQPRLILMRYRLDNMIQNGLDRYGERFGQAFGPQLELLVGDMVNLIPGATVLPEIAYEPGQLTVDWFLITPQMVALIESKIARPNLKIIAGDTPNRDEIRRLMRKPVSQLNNTYKLIQEDHPALAVIPRDRPIVGLIITSVPFHLGNPLHVAFDPADQSLPIAIGSIDSIDRMSAHSADEVAQPCRPSPATHRCWNGTCHRVFTPPCPAPATPVRSPNRWLIRNLTSCRHWAPGNRLAIPLIAICRTGELRVVAVHVEDGVDQVRVVPVAVADRVGAPFVEGLPGEPQHPAGHPNGDLRRRPNSNRICVSAFDTRA